MSNHRNSQLALSLVALALGMLMLAYASVPLYRLFCNATGFGGVAQKEAFRPHSPLDRVITVRFDANVNGALDWTFRPAQNALSVHVGEEKHVEYIARNRSAAVSTATATFNITPVKAGAYFNKIQCFCFTRQTLKPHQEEHLGVTFFIDPAINNDPDLNDTDTITLSYTFFPVQK